MTYPLVQFVDSPDPGAVVRFDFNDDALDAKREVLADGFTLGAPTLEGAPDAVGVAYGFRQPSFVLQIRGAKADALATLSELSRELLRQTNWLCVTLDDYERPVWLKTYRSSTSALSLDRVYVDGGPEDVWAVQVTLDADPFGYGERVTEGPFTVTQSPDGTNPMRVVLPTIKGDAPTGLRVTLTLAEANPSGIESEWLIGCVSCGPDLTDSLAEIGDGDGFTGGTVVTTAPTLWFDGSHRTFSPSSDTLTTILSGSLPVVSPARYKVLARYEMDGSTSVDKRLLIRLLTGPSGAALTNTGPTQAVTVEARATTAWVGRGWIDLGEINYPVGFPVPAGSISGLPAPGAAAPGVFEVQAASADGTAIALRLDALKFIPIYEASIGSATFIGSRWTQDSWPYTTALVTRAGVWDADEQLFWLDQDGILASSTPAMTGSFPIADPGSAQNILYAIAANHGLAALASSTATCTSNGAASTVDISYHPRYLHLGDGA